MICAAVALVVSVVCSFLPYLLIYVNCKKLKTKFQEKNGPSPNPLTSNQADADMSSNIRVVDKEDVSDNSSVPTSQEILEERYNVHPDQPVEDEYSDLKVMGYLMCFGGGVFLGTFLLHMLPEVTDILQTSLIQPHNIKYNLAELLVGIGFFMILFVEEFVKVCRKIRTKRSAKRKSLSGVNLNEREIDDSAKKKSESVLSGEYSFDTGKS